MWHDLKQGLLLGLLCVLIQNVPQLIMQALSVDSRVVVRTGYHSAIHETFQLDSGLYYLYSQSSLMSCKSNDKIKIYYGTLSASTHKVLIKEGASKYSQFDCELDRHTLTVAGEKGETIYVLRGEIGRFFAVMDLFVHRAIGLIFSIILVVYLMTEAFVNRKIKLADAPIALLAFSSLSYQIYFSGIINLVIPHAGAEIIQGILRILFSLALTKLLESRSKKYVWTTLIYIMIAVLLIYTNLSNVEGVGNLVYYSEILIMMFAINLVSVALYFKHKQRADSVDHFVSVVAISWTALQLVAVVFMILKIKSIATPVLTALVCTGLLINRFRDRLSLEAKNAQETESKKYLVRVADSAKQLAHDIRSPLTALKYLQNEITVSGIEIKNIYESALTRIETIADSLKDISESDTGGLSSQLHLAPESLAVVIEGIVYEKTHEWKRRVTSKCIYVTYDEPALQTFCKVDSNKFRRIISNLLNNAIEAYPEITNQTSINIEIKLISEYLYVIIKDKGKGMSPEVIGSLFHKGATFDKSGGTGLGLYDAKTYLESWGGHITIESQQCVGTSVTIAIPSFAHSTALTNQIPLINSCVIWLADDDKSLFELLKQRFHVFAKVQYEISYYSSPEELIASYLNSNASRPNLIITDYQFADSALTGIDIIRKIDKKIATLLLTTYYNDLSILAKAEQLGVQVFPKALISTIGS